MDQHSAGQGPERRHYLPLPPGAAQVTARLPPVHPGGGRPPRRPHIPGQVRREQTGVVGAAAHAARAPAHRHPQGHVDPGLEARDCQGLQHGLGYVARGRQDSLPQGDLPVAHLRLRLLRGEADDGPQLPGAPPHRNQQARRQPYSPSDQGRSSLLIFCFMILLQTFLQEGKRVKKPRCF